MGYVDTTLGKPLDACLTCTSRGCYPSLTCVFTCKVQTKNIILQLCKQEQQPYNQIIALAPAHAGLHALCSRMVASMGDGRASARLAWDTEIRPIAWYAAAQGARSAGASYQHGWCGV